MQVGYRNEKEAETAIHRHLITSLSFAIMRGVAKLRFVRLGTVRGNAGAAAKRRENQKFNHERQRLWQQLSDGFDQSCFRLPPF